MLSEMLDSCISQNVYTFSVLVNALMKEGTVKEAKEVIGNMIQRGVDPNVVTYNTLMDGILCKDKMKH